LIDLLNYQLFSFGKTPITPLGLITLLALSILLIYLSGKLKRLLVNTLLTRTPLGLGARQAVGTILRYLILVVGFIVILQTVGIDLTAFNVLAGAVGIGIGLGLQNIANNFISGLIILMERPVQVGDRVEIGGVTGKVAAIGARATRVLTNDNIAIIVPNSKLISENVVNWSYGPKGVRFRVKIMVVHEADTNLVRDLMTQAAKENEGVAEDPAPAVRFVKMDEEGLYLELRVWTRDRLDDPGSLESDLRFAIVQKFRQHNIRLSNNQPEPDAQETGEVTDTRPGRAENEISDVM